VVFECCGKQEALENAMDILKPGGKLMLIGIPEFDNWQFSADKGRRKEITIANVRRQNHALLPTLDMMQTKKIDGRTMLTHRFPFSKTKEAFDMVHEYSDGVMKAMIEFD
jgi:threonine dehydrogenase-like Zn-dependent dehydrogenase